MSRVKVTALFQSQRDGRWYLIVKYGCMVEHIRLVDENAGPTVLHTNFGIPPARARRMIEKVKA